MAWDDHIFEFLEEALFPVATLPSLWLAENINYPPIAAENNIQVSQLYCSVIERDGSASDVCSTCTVDLNSRQRLRVVKLMPQVKPGMQTGSFRYYHNSPVAFRLRYY